MNDFDKAITAISDLNPAVSVSGLPDDFLVSFVGMADVTENGRLLNKHEKSLREVKIGFTRFIEGDVLFAKITPCMENGKGAHANGLTNKTGFGSTEFHVLRNKKNGDAGFIYQILQSKDFRLKAEARMTGSAGQKRVPSDFFDFYKTFIPTSLPEQRKIARILSTVDAVIEKTEAAIAKYKAIKSGMMHDLFTCGIDLKTGKLRPRYEEKPELYKESELGCGSTGLTNQVPREWESCAMGKYISDNLYGPRFNAKDYAEDGNVKTIRGTDFTKDGYILYEKAPKAFLPAPLITTHKLKDGDVVIVTTADCGLTAVFEKPINDVDFIPSAYSVKYRFSENVNPFFIKFYMETDAAIRQVKKYVRQGTLGNLPGSDVLKFAMIFPKTGEQNEIARRLRTINTNIKNEEVVLSKNQQLKSALMSDLLTGKVRTMNNEEMNNE